MSAAARPPWSAVGVARRSVGLSVGERKLAPFSFHRAGIDRRREDSTGPAGGRGPARGRGPVSGLAARGLPVTGFDNPLCGILAALRVCPGENPGARGARPQCERRTRNGATGGRARARSAVGGRGVPPAGVFGVITSDSVLLGARTWNELSSLHL